MSWITESEIQQVKNGFAKGFGVVAGICTMGLLVYGIFKLRHPETDETLVDSLKAYPPLWVGSMSVAVAVTILWLTMNRWAKYLSGLFAYSVLGGLGAVAAGGWHSRIPSLNASRTECAFTTLLLGICAILTFRFGSGKPNFVDRVAITTSTLSFVYGATSDNSSTEFWMLGAMVAAFAVASLIDFVRHRRFFRWRSPKPAKL
jgi:hypothetical protein